MWAKSVIWACFWAQVLSQKEEFCAQKPKGQKLPELDLNPAGVQSQSQMFFIESSGRDFLLPRQVCTVESALNKAEIDNVFVILTSTRLHLLGNNATWQLTQNYPQVKFRSIDLERLFKVKCKALKFPLLDGSRDWLF